MSNTTSETLGSSLNLYEIIFNINEASGQWFAGLIILGMFITIMVVMMNRQNAEFAHALLNAGFLTTFICMGFVILEMLPMYIAILPVIALIIGFLVKYFS